MIKKYFCVPVLFIVLIVFAVTAEAAPDQKHMKNGEQAAAKSQQTDTIKKSLSEKLSVTHHKIKVNGSALKYSATAGYLQIHDESDKPRAHLFFVAYEKKARGDTSRRPIAFVFNGGPGASAAFLHLGAIGPQRVLMDGEGTSLPAETNLVTNEYTWLDFTDLVFIDPVGTGYSRAAQGVDAKQFYAVEEDVKLMSEFVRLYTTRYKRWLSPKFIIGESYGSTRAASLAGYVQNTFNMNLNGLVLISPALNFQTIKFNAGNDLPYILCVPSYTAAAWYHKKLSAELQHDFKKSMHDAEAWAQSTYCSALVKGDSLSAAERKNIIETLAQFTGLAKSYIENNNLRINAPRFVKELLRTEHRTIGVLDARVKGIDADAAGEYSEFDPALFMTTGPYTVAMNDYVRSELKYENDLTYETLNLKVNREWNWGSASQGYVNVADTLREAMSRNRHLKVFIACGYYDLATPYFATEYTVNHLGLDQGLRANLRLECYEAGHQMYTHLPSLKKLTVDVEAFFMKVLSEAGK